MKTAATLLLALLLLFAVPATSRACFCSATDAATAFTISDAVFIGKVLKISNAKEARDVQVVKEAGTLQVNKVPRRELSFHTTRIVTLEVIELFKGDVGKTFELVSLPYDKGATCGVNFKKNESFLVYAHKRLLALPIDKTRHPESAWAEETRRAEKVDQYNSRLPDFATTYCDRTERMIWAGKDVDIIRSILKTGIGKE